MRAKGHYLACVIGVWAVSASADTFELAGRAFWIGPTPLSSIQTSNGGAAYHRMEWIAPLLDADPLLGSTHFEVFPVGRTIRTSEPAADTGQSDEIPSEFQFNDSVVRALQTDLYFLREDASLPSWIALCGPYRRFAGENACRITVRFMPYANVAFQTIVPMPDAFDEPGFLQDAAARILDVAHCLDVTDQMPEPSSDTDHPACLGVP